MENISIRYETKLILRNRVTKVSLPRKFFSSSSSTGNSGSGGSSGSSSSGGNIDSSVSNSGT